MHLLFLLLIFNVISLIYYEPSPPLLIEMTDTIIHPPKDSIYIDYLKENINLRIVISLNYKNDTQSEILFNELMNLIKNINPQNITIYKNKLLIAFEAEKIKIENLFKIKFYVYYYNKNFYYFSTAPKIDYKFKDFIICISGLNNFTKAINQLYYAKVSSKVFTVEEIRKFYGFDKLLSLGYTGKGQKIVIGSVYTFSYNDINTFFDRFNIKRKEIKVHYVLEKTDKIGDETTVDIEWAVAIAPDAEIILAVIPNAKYSSFLELFNYIVSKDLGKIVSISWLIPEDILSKAEIKAANKIFEEAVKKGITFFFPSGDWGSSSDPNRKGISKPIPFYPATDPYVVSVGGTMIVGNKEIAWGGYLDNETYGSGGGYSYYFERPSYQPEEIGSKRGFPDVAYNSAEESGYYVYFNGEWKIGYGTSLAAPQWAALYAIISQINNKTLGFLNPYLYNLYKENYHEVFNDITEGTNGLYKAKEGWDPVTGLGSPKAFELAMKLRISKFLLIISNTTESISVLVNGKNYTLPLILDLNNYLNITIHIPEAYYINNTRYLYLSTEGIYATNLNVIKLNLNESGILIINFKKQFRINIVSEYPVEYQEWHDAGVKLTLTVPENIIISEGERAKFLAWTGDFNSTSNSISIILDKPYNLKIVWDIEYSITVIKSYGIVLGEGWYKKGSKANIRILDPLDFLHLLDPKIKYDDKILYANKLNIIVDKPYKIYVDWEFTINFYILLFLLLIFLSLLLFKLFYKLKSFSNKYSSNLLTISS